MEYLAAHLSKIHGLDWHPDNENVLATSSQDNSVRVGKVNRVGLGSVLGLWIFAFQDGRAGPLHLLVFVIPWEEREQCTETPCAEAGSSYMFCVPSFLDSSCFHPYRKHHTP